MGNRILKESICTSATLEPLTWFEEVCFYRLIVQCDDYGRLDARPLFLKSRLFPLREDVTTDAIMAAMERLAETGLVWLYTVDDQPYLQLLTWEHHQRVRNRRSKYPSPWEEPEPADN